MTAGKASISVSFASVFQITCHPSVNKAIVIWFKRS